MRYCFTPRCKNLYGMCNYTKVCFPSPLLLDNNLILDIDQRLHLKATGSTWIWSTNINTGCHKQVPYCKCVSFLVINVKSHGKLDTCV